MKLTDDQIDAKAEDWLNVSSAGPDAELFRYFARTIEAPLLAKIAALEAKLAQRVPEGWVPVPIEPTNEMTSAMADAIEDPENERSSWDLAENMYRAMLAAAPQPVAQPGEQPRLTVRLTAFPESNGKRNWTALLVRVNPWGGLIGNCGGITVDRGEMWNRVAYEAECARFLIGERDTEPHILDYGDDIETPEEWNGETRGGRPARKATQAKPEQAAQPIMHIPV